MVHHDVLGKDVGYSGGGGEGGNPPEGSDIIDDTPIVSANPNVERGCLVWAGASVFYVLEAYYDNAVFKSKINILTVDPSTSTATILATLPGTFDIESSYKISSFGVNEDNGYFYFGYKLSSSYNFEIYNLNTFARIGDVYVLSPSPFAYSGLPVNAKHRGNYVNLFWVGGDKAHSVNFDVDTASNSYFTNGNPSFYSFTGSFDFFYVNIYDIGTDTYYLCTYAYMMQQMQLIVFVSHDSAALVLYSPTDFTTINANNEEFYGLYPYQWPDLLGTFGMDVNNYYVRNTGIVYTAPTFPSQSSSFKFGSSKDGVRIEWNNNAASAILISGKDNPNLDYENIGIISDSIPSAKFIESYYNLDDRIIMTQNGSFEAALIPCSSSNSPINLPVILIKKYSQPAKTSNYKTLTIDASTGAVTYTLYDFTPVVNPVQGVFNFSIRVTPQSGVLIPIDFTIIIQTSGVRFSLRLSLIDITLYGETYSRVATGATQNMWATQVNCISETTGYSLVYNNTAFATLTTEPGKWLNFEGCVVKDDPTKCMMRINGDYFQPDIHTVIDTAPGGFATTDEYCLLEVNSTSAVPLQVDFCNVYGYVTATPTGTDGTDMTEPLIDYTTADMLYTSATHEALWQVNWNAVDNPYGNVGLNPGVFVGSPLAPVITIVEQVPTLNKIPDGWHRVLVLDYSKGATQSYWYIYQAKNIYQEDGQCFTVGVWNTCLNTGVGGYSYLYLYSALSATESQATFYHYFYRDSNYDYTWYGNNPYKRCFGGGAPQKMIYLTYLQDKTATPYMSKNKSTCSWDSASGTKTSSDPKAPCSVLSFYSTFTTNTYKIRYFAFYPNDVIVAHPEVPWADKTAMENYFYKTGTMNAVDDLYNAIPGCTPIVCLDGHSYRGIGIYKWRDNYIRECAGGDHHSTTLDVQGEFTAG